MTNATTIRERSPFLRHLTPITLAAMSVDLESSERTKFEDNLLDDVNAALAANVGEEEAEQFRQWYRDNV